MHKNGNGTQLVGVGCGGMVPNTCAIHVFFAQFVPIMHLICHYIVHKNTYTLINIHGYLDSTVIWHLRVSRLFHTLAKVQN